MSALGTAVGVYTGTTWFKWLKWILLLLLIAAMIGVPAYYSYHAGYDRRDSIALKKELGDALAAKIAQDKLILEVQSKQKAIDVLTENLATSLGNVKIITKTVHDQVLKEIQIPIYKDCKVPATGVTILRDSAIRYNALIPSKNEVIK